MLARSATAGVGSAQPHAYRPLLAAWLRLPALFVMVLALVMFAVLALRYNHQDTAGRLDRTLDAFIIIHLRSDHRVTAVLVSLADPDDAAIVLAAAATVAAIVRRWSGLLLVVGGTVTAVVIAEVVLKPLVGRLRDGHLAFPSGHTTAVAALALAVAIVLTGARWPRSVALRLLASLAVVGVAAGVAVALIVQRIHYATDTLAGCCVAIFTVFSLALTLDCLGPRVRSLVPRIWRG